MKNTDRMAHLAQVALMGMTLGMASCGGGTETGIGADGQVAAAAAETFIHNPDATDILPSWSKENTVVFHITSEPDDLHPSNGTQALRSHINQYTQMYIMGADLIELKGVRPGVVKGPAEMSADGLRFTYVLRDEPRWDNGEQLSVDDIIFTYKANKCPLTNNPHGKPYLENLADIVKDPADPRKFTLVMKRKYIHNSIFTSDYPLLQESYWDKAKTLRNFTFAQFDDPDFKADAIKELNAWATEYNNPRYSRVPEFLVGLGAYRVVDWKPNQSLTLERKAGHWTTELAQTTPYETSLPDRIIFKVNTDGNSQLLEFKAQALDASTFLSTQGLIDLQADASFNANYNSRFTNTYNYSYLGFNCRPDGVTSRKFFDDVRVRRAIAKLVPVDEINMVINRGKNQAICSPVSPLKKEYNSDLKLITYDLEGAKQLLDEAGWKDTDGDNIRDKVIDGKKVQFEFNLNYMTNMVTWRDMASMISEKIYEAGIVCNIVPLDPNVNQTKMRSHEFDAALSAWAGSSVPDDFTQIWHTTSWASKGSNYVGFGNAASDALIDSIKYNMDEASRHTQVKRLQQMIYDYQPMVFLFATVQRNVIHKRFGNADMYFERPGVLLNNLKLLSGSMKESVEH